ncbi:hypothetical protein ABI077_15205 [Enterococcus faecium]
MKISTILIPTLRMPKGLAVDIATAIHLSLTVIIPNGPDPCSPVIGIGLPRTSTGYRYE